MANYTRVSPGVYRGPKGAIAKTPTGARPAMQPPRAIPPTGGGMPPPQATNPYQQRPQMPQTGGGLPAPQTQTPAQTDDVSTPWQPQQGKQGLMNRNWGQFFQQPAARSSMNQLAGILGGPQQAAPTNDMQAQPLARRDWRKI